MTPVLGSRRVDDDVRLPTDDPLPDEGEAVDDYLAYRDRVVAGLVAFDPWPYVADLDVVGPGPL